MSEFKQYTNIFAVFHQIIKKVCLCRRVQTSEQLHVLAQAYRDVQSQFFWGLSSFESY